MRAFISGKPSSKNRGKMEQRQFWGTRNNYYFGKQVNKAIYFGGLVGWLCWGLTSQSTIFQSCRDGAIASWVINQYFRGVKCLAQGHNTAAVGLEPRTSRSGVRHSTTEPPRSPISGEQGNKYSPWEGHTNQHRWLRLSRSLWNANHRTSALPIAVCVCHPPFHKKSIGHLWILICRVQVLETAMMIQKKQLIGKNVCKDC